MANLAQRRNRKRVGAIVAIGCIAIAGLYFLPRGAAWYYWYTSDDQIWVRTVQRGEKERRAKEARHAAAVAALSPADRAALLQIVRDYYAAHPGSSLPAPEPT